MNQCKWNIIWSVTLILMFSGTAFAVSERSSIPRKGKLPTGTGMGEIIIKWVDIAHAQISKRILKSSERFDAFFGDERIEEETQNTQIKVTTFVEITEGKNPKLTFPLSANLAFPRLKNRWHLAVETLIKEDDGLGDGGSGEGKDDDKAEDDKSKDGVNDVTLSVRYKILQKARKWLSLASGVKVKSDQIEPFGKLRSRRVFDSDPWALRLTQFVFWVEGEGWGETSRIDIDRRIRRKMFFRMTSKTTWSENSEGVELTQSFFLRWRVSHLRAIELELSGEGHTEPMMVADKCNAKLTYRRRLYKNWLFFDMEPEAEFLREDNFKLTSLITFKFDFKLGHVPRP